MSKARTEGVKTSEAPPSRSRVPGLVATAVALLAGCWGAYRYGPRPVGVQADAAPQVATAPSPDVRPLLSDVGAFPGQVLDELAPASGGHVPESPSAYLDAVERVYLSRGYQKLEELVKVGAKKRGRRAPPGRYYWRYEPPGGGPVFIGARGLDADPERSGPESRPMAVTVMVEASADRGSDYTIYRHEVNAAELQGTAGSKDISGVDPPGVPRHPSVRRLFSLNNAGVTGRSLVSFYTSPEPPASLAQWYQGQMSGSWTPEPGGALRDASDGGGVMTFTRGASYCLVWVAAGRGGGPTTVIVSLRS